MIGTSPVACHSWDAGRPWGEAVCEMETSEVASDDGSETRPMHVFRSTSSTIVVEVHGNQRGFLEEWRVGSIAGRLEEIAGKMECSDIVIDLSHVTFINAQFLNVLDSFRRRLTVRGQRLSLCGVGAHCADLLCSSGLDEMIECHAAPHSILRQQKEAI